MSDLCTHTWQKKKTEDSRNGSDNKDKYSASEKRGGGTSVAMDVTSKDEKKRAKTKKKKVKISIIVMCAGFSSCLYLIATNISFTITYALLYTTSTGHY